jgi:RNA polymerase sigma-70 factor (ECF subfamily)
MVTEAGRDAGALVAAPADLRLVERMRAGDEAAFVEVVGRHHAAMLRVARIHVASDAVAEEVVQEAWLGVLRQLDRFEGRASLRTWIFRIVANIARTRGVQERRTVPFSALVEAETRPGEPTVEPDRFLDRRQGSAGHWATPPRSWAGVPEERLLSKETMALVERAIGALPPVQRAVITLRDVAGCGAPEVCELLGLSDGNQRVLLHRARAAVRRALARHLDRPDGTAP